MNTKVHARASETAAQLAADLRGMLSRLKRRLREQGGSAELTPSQVAVILRIEKDGAGTASALARVEGMRPQSMSAIVASLLDAGMVRVAPDPQDGRKTLISLSRKCEKVLLTGRAARQDWLAHAIAQELTVQEQQQVLAAVALLNRIADQGQ